MAVFYLLILIPVVMQHIAIKDFYIDYQKRNKMALEFFFVFLTILVMLRHESIGNDTRNYLYYFDKDVHHEWSELGKGVLEIGFCYFNKIISLFSTDHRFYLAVSAIVVSSLIYPTYKRLCSDVSLTIVLFCIMSTFVMMFSGIRQMLAVGLGFVAYDFTRRKKPLAFLLTVGLALLIHTSAFMILFMYPLYHARITRKWLLVVVPVMAVVFVFNKQIFSVMTLILERFTKYEGGISSTGAYTMLLVFAAFAVFSFLIPDESRMDTELIGLRNFLLFALVIQMFAPLHTLAMRMNYYYIIFIPLLIPKIVECRRKRWCQVAMLSRHIMVLFFLAYFFLIKANSGGNLNVFPYHFFWEEVW